MSWPRAVLAIPLAALGACEMEPSRSDSGELPIDAAPARDGGIDASLPEADAARDSGFDAGPDAWSAPTGIAGVRWGLPGAAYVDLDGAVVTYVAPAVGAQPAGFFVQEGPSGPALFVAIDPADLRPSPRAGDRLRFQVVHHADVGGLRIADEIAALTIQERGTDLAGWAQRVAPAELARDPYAYESELVAVEGTIGGSFVESESSWLSAELLSGAEPSGTRLRVAASLRTALALEAGCSVDLAAVPAWRDGPRCSPSAWRASDLIAADCPGPRMSGAAALDRVTVEIRFDRTIDVSSVRADGSQFSFTDGLSAIAARAEPRRVTVTTIEQTFGATYTVTVDASVLGPTGSSVDPAARSAIFVAPLAPARLRLNEIGPGLPSFCDLVELRVIESGDLDGVVVEQNGAPIMRFDRMARVERNDLVMVHVSSGPACTGTSADETESIAQYPRASYSLNFDTAWDWYARSGNLNDDALVLVVRGPDGTVQDAFVGHGASFFGTMRSDALEAATSLLGSGEWTSSPPPVTMTPMAFYDIALRDISYRQSRVNDLDTNTRLDWACQADGRCPFGRPNSMGRLNGGQAPLGL